MLYAHSLPDGPSANWEGLADHLDAVARLAASFAARFGWAEVARAAGLLHDIGKVSAAFQNYLNQGRDPAAAKGPDHSTAGARAAKQYGDIMGRLLAYIIAGHHAGLADFPDLKRRLTPADYTIQPHDGWQALTGPLPAPKELTAGMKSWKRGRHSGFSQSFLTRMLFSCLVDADFLATEAFYKGAAGEAVSRGGHADILTLRDRLNAYLAKIDGRGDDPVSQLRSRVLAAARAKAAMPPGLFTLTVPTGGGKTFASLAFALEHAARHGMRRVIHVAPFAAIIDQTAAVFQKALDSETDVLAHHASAEWRDTKSQEGEDTTGKLARAAENWDVPVVVTTAVQFFESLFAHRTGRCRKLHNLAGAVIILDEAQAMPLPVLRPCLAAIEELALNYGATVVLCTATQPALRESDDFRKGLPIGPEREIAPDPVALFTALRRVRVSVRPEPVADATIAARFAEQPQMLCIVNSRKHARELFEAIAPLPGALHLSTLMVPKHRRRVLETLRQRVKDQQPARLVSTSLIEAGVDLDLPEVWRAMTGLDSIAQAAGRCNRNGQLQHGLGQVVVFTPEGQKPPRAVLEALQATQRVLMEGHADLLGLDAIRAYFRELYWQKGDAALDALEIQGQRGVLALLKGGAGDWSFPFASIGESFRLIDDVMPPVVVPWDAEAVALLRRIRAQDRATVGDLRRLQPYTVSIPRAAWQDWLRHGALETVHAGLGEALMAFNSDAHYRIDTGLDLSATMARDADRNLF